MNPIEVTVGGTTFRVPIHLVGLTDGDSWGRGYAQMENGLRRQVRAAFGDADAEARWDEILSEAAAVAIMRGLS